MNNVTVNVNTNNQVFNFGDHQVRTVIKEGEPWFVASDVSSVLDYRSANDMTRNLDDEEKDTQTVRTRGGEQLVSIINESGLYSAILKSRKPEAKAFKKWVTSEVLPSIRKRGMFSLSDVSSLIEEARLNSENFVYVYVVENEVTGSVKVGVSSSPKKRLSTLQTGTEHKLNLVHVSDATVVVSEKKVHELLNESCIRGEWFNVSTDEAISAVSYVVNTKPLTSNFVGV